MALRWRIYYDDGSTFDDSMGTPLEAPASGVQLIVYRTPDYSNAKAFGANWYFWNEECQSWWNIDVHGILDRLQYGLPVDALKQGRSISNERYRDIIQRAREDEDFS